MQTKALVPTLVVVALATGCQSNPSKEDWGATLGALGGAVLGAAVAGDNKWLGAAIGGAAGYYAGRAIGRHLDEQDRKALAASTVDALEQEGSGVATWNSDRSGASAEIKTGEISYQAEPKQVKRLATVEAVPSIKLESRQYETTSALRVRAGPGTRYGIVTTLNDGDVVTSAGRTDNGWLMLAKQGVTVGYVHGDYVQPYNPVQAVRAKGIDLDSEQVETLPKQEGFAGIDLDTVETTSSTVTAQRGCRDVEISVSTKQGTEQETTQACQKPDGVWELG